jgi:hypothetical protein
VGQRHAGSVTCVVGCFRACNIPDCFRARTFLTLCSHIATCFHQSFSLTTVQSFSPGPLPLLHFKMLGCVTAN